MRALARLVALLGAVGVGLLLFRAAPRDVALVYDLSHAPGATSVEVTLRRDDALIRRAELAVPAGTTQVRHRVELSDGTYDLAYRVATAVGALEGHRPVEVRESGTIVLPLGP